MPQSESADGSYTAAGFYSEIKNDVQGIGQDIFDSSWEYGSGGKLKGTIDMGWIKNIVANPMDSGFEDTMRLLSHEILHRWSAYVKFRTPAGEISEALLGVKSADQSKGAHWSYLLDTSGSVMYGNRWRNNNDGTFTSLPGRKYYSPLDLYLMGVVDKTEVPPMMLIQNPDIPAEQFPENGTTIEGTPVWVNIEDIIAAEGERIPSAENSQKAFKLGCILLVRPGQFTGEELPGIRNVIQNWTVWFSSLTQGKARVFFDAVPSKTIPGNPGIEPPVYDPRDLPPEINDGVAWLIENQNENGSWSDSTGTIERDTAGALIALNVFSEAAQSLAKGQSWFDTADPVITAYLTAKIESLSYLGDDTSLLTDQLRSEQNQDGGWGGQAGYISNPANTALALKALATSGHYDSSEIEQAFTYLKSVQSIDGGWLRQDGESDVQLTADVLSAFYRFRELIEPGEEIQQALLWLSGKQNPDGGFGNSPSTIYDTAAAVNAFMEYSYLPESAENGLNYILNLQSADGGWYDSAYQTAAAVSAIWSGQKTPDLSVSTNTITFIPETISVLPTEATIRVKVSNTGLIDVEEALILLYKDAVDDDNVIGEHRASIQGRSSETIDFTTVFEDGNTHKFFIKVDPGDEIAESSESNNTALKMLYPETSFDFEVLSSGITITPSPAELLNTVVLESQITNKGASEAFDVSISYYIDDPQGPVNIAISSVDIPAGQTVTHTVEWRADQYGQNLPIAVRIDSQDTFLEISEDNNKAVVPLTVSASNSPNLTVFHKEIGIDPSPAAEGGAAEITAMIHNQGAVPAENVRINCYHGLPENNLLIDAAVLPEIGAGLSQSVVFSWADIKGSGDRMVVIVIDPDNQIDEIDETDNQTFITAPVKSLPDLFSSYSLIAFDPAAPRQGEPVNIAMTVMNAGDQDADYVPLAVYDGGAPDPIWTGTIPKIQGNTEGSISFTFDTTSLTGVHSMRLVIDPNNAIREKNEDNNTASRGFSLQDADLWISERLISPDGDGIKDQTVFSFRIGEPQMLRVEVVDDQGNVIRTFNGGEYLNSAGETVTWDGLDDLGRLVKDGQYMIRAAAENGTVISSLPVVIDTNRSDLAEAAGSKYLLETNMTCMAPYNELPYYHSSNTYWRWLPDESGIIAYLSYYDVDAPEYPVGIYYISSDGGEPIRITPNEWNDEGDVIKFSYYPDKPFILSQDGNKILVGIKRYERYIGTTNQLWIMNRFGEERELLDKDTDTYSVYPGTASLSPDNNYIAYRRSNDEIVIQKIDGTQAIQFSGYESGNHIKWAPDSRSLVFTSDNDLFYADISGDPQKIFEGENSYLNYKYIEWMTNGKIAVVNNGNRTSNLWIIDATEQNDTVFITDKASIPVISSDRQYLAFTQTDETWRLYTCDINGNAQTIYESTFTKPDFCCDDYWYEYDQAQGEFYDCIYMWEDDDSIDCSEFEDEVEMWENLAYECEQCGYDLYSISTLQNIKWSAQGSRVAFIEMTYSQFSYDDDVLINTSPIVVDIDKKSLFKGEPILKNFWCGNFQHENIYMNWLKDDNSLISTIDGNSSVITNTKSGEQTSLYSPLEGLSPNRNFITYTKNVSSDSVCYGRGNKDLYNLRSLLNLTAELYVVQEESAVVLRGIAADLNFSHYTLEYANLDTPNNWEPISPPSDIPVMNDVFTVWTPPEPGNWLVKLTVHDKAGNMKWTRKRVYWSEPSVITNLSRNGSIFSPNNDGVKESVELNYYVNEPVHLEFKVYNENGEPIRTIAKDHIVPENGKTVWDGRDQNGLLAPDGVFEIRVLDFTFSFEVDTTPPDVNVKFNGVEYTNGDWMVELLGFANDALLKSWVVEYGVGDNPDEWFELKSGGEALVKKTDSGLIETDENGLPIFAVIETFEDAGIDFPVGKKFRISAEDYAGNRSTAVSGFIEEIIACHAWWEHDNNRWYSLPLKNRSSVEFIALNPVPANLIFPGIHMI